MKHNNKILWGILLVLTGVLVALSALGMLSFPMGISIWKIVLAVGVMAVLIEGILRLEFSQTFLMLGIEVIIFEEAIGALLGKTEADWINNWVVILISLLIGIGLDLIFAGLKRRLKKGRFKLFCSDNAFADGLKYIDASKMKKEYIRSNFGDFEVRFENAGEYEGGGELTLENSFGDMVIYVPENWEVEVNVENHFGDVTVDDRLRVQYADGSGKKLIIKGTNRFGDLDVRVQR